MAVRAGEGYSEIDLAPLGDARGGWEEELGSERLRRDESSSGELLQVDRDTSLSRENSFLAMRNRAKSMDGGTLRPSIASLHHTNSSISSKFQPPQDYNLYNWLIKKLNKLRKRTKGRENEHYLKVKKHAKKIVESSLFKLFMFVVVISHAVLLGLYQPEVRGDTQTINNIIQYIIIGLVSIYVMEACLHVVAYGLILHPKESFLRRPKFILDITVILFGILYLSLRSTLPVLAELFSSLMMLKLIRLLALSNSMRFMLKALAKSVRPLLYLSVLTALCLVFLALIGIELFRGSLHGGCFSNYTTPAGVSRQVLVSEFPCHYDGNSSDNETSSLRAGDHRCPYKSQCMFWEDGPFHGVVSFDDMFRALLVVFQSITLEGWSGIFFLYESAVGEVWAWLYFFFVIMLGSVFILNMWTGVLTLVFVDVSEREQKHGHTRKLIEQKRTDKDLAQYTEWLRKGAELQHPSDTRSIDRAPFAGGILGGQDKEVEYLEEEEMAGDERAGTEGKKRHKGCCYKTSKAVSRMVQSKVWFWVIILCHVVNLSLLMALHFPESHPNFNDTIYILNYVFSGFYVLDLLLKVYGIGIVQFFIGAESLFNVGSKIAEVLLGLLSLVSLVVFLPIASLRRYQLPVVINAIWSTKIVLIGKISDKNWERVQEVLKTLGGLTKVILSLMGLIGLFLYIFTIGGMRIFGHRLSVTGFVQPNFDDILNSFYLVFQLLTTEDWHNVLYNSVGAYIVQERAIGLVTVLYFMAAIVIGALILVNVFLALSVEKLSEIRDLEEDESKEKESEEKERKERKEQISALKNPKVEVRRRTIRRILRLQASNPRERLKSSVEPSKNRWWKRLSLPHFIREQKSSREFKRSTSTPAGPTLSVEEKREGSETSGERIKSKKRHNPLSSVEDPTSYFNLEMIPSPPPRELTGFEHENFAPTAVSTRVSRLRRECSPPPVIMEEGEGEEGDSVFDYNQRQMSIASSPPIPLPVSGGGVERERGMMVLDRTHSLPTADRNFNPKAFMMKAHSIPETESCVQTQSSTSISESGRRSRLSRQESIHDEDMLNFSRDSPSSPLSPESSSPSQTPRYEHQVNLTHRYLRGTSLEPIHQQEGRGGEHAKKKTAGNKIREKLEDLFKYMTEYIGTLHFDPSRELTSIPPHTSFFFIDHNNSFRKFCFKVVKSQPFRTLTYAVIFLSSLVLMLELPNGLVGDNPSDARTGFCAFQNIIIWLDTSIISFFILEIFLKMISLGVIVHRDSYLRGFFNIMDFLVTILTLIPIIYYLSRIDDRETRICISYGYDTSAVPKAIGVLRVFRVIRPLRAIRIKGLYLVVTGLLSSFKSMLTIFLLDALIVVIFGIVGVQYFKGSFYFCTDPSIQTEDECIGYYFKYDYAADLSLEVPGLTCPVAEQRIWTQWGLNFDNIGNATLSLFTMLTAEGWQNVMYSGINSHPPLDSRTPLASVLENNRAAALYFILYMIVMTFILLQLLIGFVIVTFQEVGVKTFRETKLDRNQRNCLHLALTQHPHLQWAPKYKFQERFGKRVLPYVNSLPVKALIVGVLLFNIIILSLQQYNQEGLRIVIYYLNVACTVFFALEAIIKLSILTPPIYFRDFWNAFGFCIALGSVIELIVQKSNTEYIVSREHLLYSHIVSTFRVLRLIEFIPKVRRLLWTVLRSLEIFPWVGYLLVIIVYTYAVVGMHVFGTVERATVDESEVKGIHEYNSFATFYNALFLMIRVITGENWQDVMLNCVSPQPCDNSTGIADPNAICGDPFAFFFFPSFYLISTIMILNLFVAIIMDNFDYIVWDRSRLGAYNLVAFVKQWAKYDPQGKGKLKPDRVFDLLKKIDPPVGWGRLCPRITAYKKMMRLNIPIRKEKETVEGVEKDVKMVTFNASLFALVRSTLEIDCRGCADCKKKCNVDLKTKLIKLFPDMPESRFDDVLAKESDETVADEYAAMFVQAEWRSFMLRRRKIMDLFKGPEKKLVVHREIQDPGPDLLRERPLSNFNHDLEILDPRHNRKVSESSRSSGRSRLGSRSPRSPLGPSPMLSPLPILDPTGTSFLLFPHSNSSDEQVRSRSPVLLSPDKTTPTIPPTSSPNGGSPRAIRSVFSLGSPPTHSPSEGVASSHTHYSNEAGSSADSPYGGRRSEGDDLSYASARSNPSASQESLTDQQVMETTV